MVHDWPLLPLREANVTLIDCEHRTPPASEEGYPYVAIPQLRDGRIDISTARRITHEHFVEWTRKATPSADDVVLSRRTNPGETAFVPPGLEFALGQNLVLLRSDGTKVYPPFLRWLVRGPEWWEQISKFLNVGAVFDSLKCADVPNFELCIPPLSEQRAIAHILGTLDDKIELNRRINESLEAITRAVFKSWFVDFDPVRANAEGREMGLSAGIADLFPERFEDSQLGPIPEGWEVATFRDILSPSNGRVNEEELPEYSATVDGLFPRSDRFKKRLAKSRSKNKKIEAGDLVFGLSRRVINFGLMQDEGGAVSPVYEVFKVNSGKVDPVLLEQSFRINMDVHMDILRPGAREGQPIDREFLLSKEVLIPDRDVQDGYSRFTRSHRERKRALENETATLAELRDTLLPELISGRLRLTKPERFLAE